MNSIEEICNTTHEILQKASKNLPIPNANEARHVRKKISVFTYAVIQELCLNTQFDGDEVYKQYLIMGGLTSEQADNIVKRTRDEFSKLDYGEECFLVGKEAVYEWVNEVKKIEGMLRKIL